MALIIEAIQPQEPLNIDNLPVDELPNLPVDQLSNDITVEHREHIQATRITLLDAVEQLKDQNQIGLNVSYVQEGEVGAWQLRCTIISQDPVFDEIRNQTGILTTDMDDDLIFETNQTVHTIAGDQLNHAFAQFVEAYNEYMSA